VISESCQVVSTDSAELWLLSGEVPSPLVDLLGGDGDAVGGGGDRIRFGVILTMGLICFDVGASTCFASGDGVDVRATSGLQPGVSAISRTASDLCSWGRSKRRRGGCLGVTSNLVSLEAAGCGLPVFTRLRGASSSACWWISKASNSSATLLRGLSHFPSER
jgi:hypothetical protein